MPLDNMELAQTKDYLMPQVEELVEKKLQHETKEIVIAQLWKYAALFGVVNAVVLVSMFASVWSIAENTAQEKAKEIAQEKVDHYDELDEKLTKVFGNATRAQVQLDYIDSANSKTMNRIEELDRLLDLKSRDPRVQLFSDLTDAVNSGVHRDLLSLVKDPRIAFLRDHMQVYWSYIDGPNNAPVAVLEFPGFHATNYMSSDRELITETYVLDKNNTKNGPPLDTLRDTMAPLSSYAETAD